MSGGNYSSAGSILGAATSLISGLMNNKAQQNLARMQISAQKNENQKTREYNLMLARLQNRYNIEQWQRENDYNTPIAIMSRLRDAGLNPNLALSGGALSGLRSAESPQMTSGYSTPPADVSTPYNRVTTMGQAMQKAIETALLGSQIRKNVAESNLMDKKGVSEGYNSDILRSEARFADALNSGRVTLQDMEVKLKGSVTSLNEAQKQFIYWNTRFTQQKIEESEQKIAESAARIRQVDTQNQIRAFEAALKSKEVDARVKNLAASTHLTYEEARDLVVTRSLRMAGLASQADLNDALRVKAIRESDLAYQRGQTEKSHQRNLDASSDLLELEFDVNSSMKEWRMAIEKVDDVVSIATDVVDSAADVISAVGDLKPSLIEINEAEQNIDKKGNYSHRSRSKSIKKSKY